MSAEKDRYFNKLRNIAEDANLAWWKDATDVRDESDVLLEAVASQVIRDLLTDLPSEPLWTGGGESVDLRDLVEQFARERGVNLEGGER